MTNRYLYRFLTLCSCSVALLSHSTMVAQGNAATTQATKENSAFAEVAPRTTKKNRMKVQKMRAQEQQERKDLAEEECKLDDIDAKTLSTKCVNSWSTDFVSSHCIQQIAPNGSFIGLDDGSGWTVAERDIEIVNNWEAYHPVEIRPNDTGFLFRAYCTYKLYNKKTKGSVQVNLVQGPDKIGQKTKQISSITPAQKQIFLSNRTAWSINPTPANMEVFKNWRTSDYIIIGTNNWYWYDMFGGWSPHIIINVSDNSYVTGDRLY